MSSEKHDDTVSLKLRLYHNILTTDGQNIFTEKVNQLEDFGVFTYKSINNDQ